MLIQTLRTLISLSDCLTCFSTWGCQANSLKCVWPWFSCMIPKWITSHSFLQVSLTANAVQLHDASFVPAGVHVSADHFTMSPRLQGWWEAVHVREWQRHVREWNLPGIHLLLHLGWRQRREGLFLQSELQGAVLILLWSLLCPVLQTDSVQRLHHAASKH